MVGVLLQRWPSSNIVIALSYRRRLPAMSRSKVSKGKDQRTGKPEPPPASYPAFLRQLPDDAVSLSLHAKPGAKACSITISCDTLSVAVSAPARDGEANAGIVDYIADVLGLQKRDVSLCVGSKSREKVLHAQGITAEEALALLRAASDK